MRISYPTLYAACMCFFALCTTVNNPYKNPENISISLSTDGDGGIVFHSVSDTFKLTIALKLADLVASVIVDWNSATEARDTIKTAVNSYEDTIIVKHIFTGEGRRLIRASAIPSNSRMQKSAEMTIRIGRRPVIDDDGRVLVPKIRKPGAAFFMAIAATGTDTLRYAWYRGGRPVPGGISDTIDFDSLSAADTGAYCCVVSNNWGKDTSNIYHLLDTVSINTTVRIAVTSPLMQSDSAVIRSSLLAIAGTVSSAAGIAGVIVSVNSRQVPIVGAQSWAFSVSELALGAWNRVEVIARDNDGAGDTLTAFLFFMPNLSAPPAPAVRDRECMRIDLEWRKIPLCKQYLLYRFSGDSLKPDTVMETADTTFHDSGLISGHAYSYAYRGWYSVPGMKAIADTTPLSAHGAARTVQCYEKTFGGLNNDNAIGVVATPDSGCLVAGASMSTRPGYSDVYLVRLNGAGDTVWSKPYGPMQNYSAATMRPGAGGEVIVGGGYTCESCGMLNVPCITAFSMADGAPIFNTIRGRPESNPAYDAARSNAGGFVYVSWTRPLGPAAGVDTVLYAYMLNAQGDSVWQKYLTFDNINAKPTSLTQGADGSLYITGVSSPAMPPIGGAPPQPHCFIAKLSATGDSLWSRTYGAATTYTKGMQIRPTSDGGFIVAGETAITGLPRDMYLLKITSAGAVQWSYTYGTTGDDFAAQVVECTDGGFALAGGTYGASGTDCNAYLVKTDALGVKLWDAVFGGAQFDCARGLTQTPDSGFVLAGETGSFGAGGMDMYIIKTDKRGSKIK